jgi:cytochrome c-type protein NapB
MHHTTKHHNKYKNTEDLNSNKCLSCHSRRRTEETQAIMISVTHYMDRDGNFLAEVSPRRYFCEQCHVAQTDARPLVESTFQDVDELLAKQRAPAQ